MSEKNINDLITSAESILTNENSSFVTRANIVSKPNYTVRVNRDLVGEPVNPGIYDETTGKIVPVPTPAEVNAKVHKELEAAKASVDADIATKTEKFQAQSETHSEISQQYVASIGKQTTALTQIKSKYDDLNSKAHLTEENKEIYLGQINGVSAEVYKLDKEFDKAIEEASKAKTVETKSATPKTTPTSTSASTSKEKKA